MRERYFIKRFSFLLFAIVLGVTLIACNKQEVVKYTVSFNTDGGSEVISQQVEKGKTATKPSNPTKDGFEFKYWYLTDDSMEFEFQTPIESDITLITLWVAEGTQEKTAQELIQEDIVFAEENLVLNPYQLNFPVRGGVNRSFITWKSNSSNISNVGIVLPLRNGDTPITGEVTGTFKYDDVTIAHTFTVEIKPQEEVVIQSQREVPFTNITTEYEVADGVVNLYFEENGSVPYIKVEDFFNLIKGFIDPAVEFTITRGEGTIEIFYQYYSESEDKIYDLICTIDANTNLITTNDPGFYWAYVYSTETNYGRHIEYEYNHPDTYYQEGNDLVYDLNTYQLDMALYDDGIVLPLYLVNQLFAGSSYYNVYYNYDKLLGIYSLPDAGTLEYRTIKSSTMNNKKIPGDLVVHTYNMLAFNLDYFYGLKDLAEVETYYDLLDLRIKKLLTNDPQALDEAISELLLKGIDEPHTSYGYPSYYNKTSWGGPDASSLSVYGTRFTQWYYDGFVDVDDMIEAKWGRTGITANQWAANSTSRPNYWFLDDKHAVITFDSFVTADIEESNTYDATLVSKVLEVEDASEILDTITTGNKFFYYNNSGEDDRTLEILIKGTETSPININYIYIYIDQLKALGYTHVITESSNVEKQFGYLTKSIGDVTYFARLQFDSGSNLLYIGVTTKNSPKDYESAWPIAADITGLIESDSAVYLEIVFDQLLAEKPLVENVALDLTWNTGGNVGALYRVVGFVTSEAFRISDMDKGTNSASSTYVRINGVPVYEHFNWSLIASPLTFSAANELVTIFKENNLGPVIGQKSGGGASSITPVLLPNGTAFTMSSNNMNAWRTGSGTEEDPYIFHDNEYGVEPDYLLETQFLLNTEKLLEIYTLIKNDQPQLTVITHYNWNTKSVYIMP